ncbi:CU044_5270 family protein [Streptomyces sp. CRN 30]|uniref:CU044_5270 family protein n=1 Tax=Streptomyces sp. CRN 30 TaxID=3075613 RepID=UPI002A825F17|nr:CU044_5270 family protein [Streptomyces sp. CRN 30]
MNADGSGSDRTVHDDLRRLLPPPPERDLAADRHSLHKDRLMQLIDNDRGPSAAPAPAPRRRPLRPALWMPLAATALAGVVAVTLVQGPGDGDSGTTTDATAGGDSAVVLLQQVADVAAETDTVRVRDDQLVYLKSLETGAEVQDDGRYVPQELSRSETWINQDPAPTKKLAEVYQDGAYYPTTELLPEGSPGVPAGIDRPTYTWLSTLPTDPDALLDRLYELTADDVDADRDRNLVVFRSIGSLVGGTYMPAETAAAMYEAAARIPGVTREADSVDAAGRHGIGIRYVDEEWGAATEWVFDPATLTYLGERTYFVKDSAAGKKGLVIEEYAVLERAVVDHYRERPKKTAADTSGAA